MIIVLHYILFFNQIFATLSYKVIYKIMNLFGVFGIVRHYSMTSYMYGSRKIYAPPLVIS